MSSQVGSKKGIHPNKATIKGAEKNRQQTMFLHTNNFSDPKLEEEGQKQ